MEELDLLIKGGFLHDVAGGRLLSADDVDIQVVKRRYFPSSPLPPEDGWTVLQGLFGYYRPRGWFRIDMYVPMYVRPG